MRIKPLRGAPCAIFRFSLLLLLLAGCEQMNAGAGGGGGGSIFAPAESNEGKWGVRCTELRGKDRMQFAKAYAESLKKVAGLKPELVQVYHDPDVSTIYYGRYAPVYTATGDVEAFRPDNRNDLKLIRDLTFNSGGQIVRPFAAEMRPLPEASTGKPEWNLENVAGYWSLQVGVFYNTKDMTERRRAAEEYCKLLRDQGQEAYYHHGPVRSSVCIGTFPFDAIAQISEEDPMTGRITVKSKIVNKKMLDAQKRFPHNTENGFTVYNLTRDASGKVTSRVPNESFPVELPRAQKKAAARQGT